MGSPHLYVWEKCIFLKVNLKNDFLAWCHTGCMCDVCVIGFGYQKAQTFASWERQLTKKLIQVPSSKLLAPMFKLSLKVKI